MALFGFRRMSFLTHGMQGRRWARRHAYPGDEHGVRVPVYGWVDAEAAAAVRGVAGSAAQAWLPAPQAATVSVIEPAVAVPHGDDRIATFPTRA